MSATQSLEEHLWNAANQLRGGIAAADYKHIVLALIFLKFISDTFYRRRQQLIDEDKGDYTETEVFYTQVNAFYLPIKARWGYIKDRAHQPDIAKTVDNALAAVENHNKTLRGALPNNYFVRLNLENSNLSALIDTINNINTIADPSQDIIGQVYEYFLGKFAANEGQRGGEFYTPSCIVQLIAEMIEPFAGKIYDPCCGSGGMFVQSIKFVEKHQGNKKHISIYGQEFTATTHRLAKMNLAVRAITANLGEKPANTFKADQHPDLKADYIMANPPFNQKKWRGDNELTDDPRWANHTIPPTNNANYAWILHIISKLSADGTAGFVLANGSMSSSASGEDNIRRQIINKDLVDCMIALPGQLFYTTQIPACLWFLTPNKKARQHHRDRRGQTLFIDARQHGTMTSRVHKELTAQDIAQIAHTYHQWRNQDGKYQDVAGYCKSAAIADIAENNYILTPGRYVGMAQEQDNSATFSDTMAHLTHTLQQQMQQSTQLDKEIRQNLATLGYDIKSNKYKI